MKKSVLSIAVFSVLSVSAQAETWGGNNSATGTYATAWGNGSLASGDYATAWGEGRATGAYYATAWGDATASGYRYATAWGYSTSASGSYSTAWGESNGATGSLSTSWGYNNTAKGSNSTVWGEENLITGGSATAWGFENRASGSNSTIWGIGNEVSGNNATAFGNNTIANARNSVALGQYNVEFPDVNPNSAADSDPLFSLGNGESDSNRSNAITVLRDGTTTFGNDVFVYGGIYELSDVRLKSNVEPLYFSQDLVMDLNPVSYVMESDPEQKNQIGFIAQEVEELLPELVGESIDGYKTVDYAKLTAVLVSAFQSLKKENAFAIQELKKENAQLKKVICKDNKRASVCK